MHLAFWRADTECDRARRDVLLGAAAAAATAGILGSGPARAASRTQHGFKGAGPMNMSTGEDWIDTFFTGGASEIIHYYADDFVFEDVTFGQTIADKGDLYRAFLPFNNAGPDAPLGVHQFDIVRYDGGPRKAVKTQLRDDVPEGYTAEKWAEVSHDVRLGADLDADEWAVMNWIWKAKHNGDFLGMPAKGKTTYARGMTLHFYRNRKIVREYTQWNFRGVAIQLGAIPPQEKFWLKDYAPPKQG